MISQFVRNGPGGVRLTSFKGLHRFVASVLLTHTGFFNYHALCSLMMADASQDLNCLYRT